MSKPLLAARRPTEIATELPEALAIPRGDLDGRVQIEAAVVGV